MGAAGSGRPESGVPGTVAEGCLHGQQNKHIGFQPLGCENKYAVSDPGSVWFLLQQLHQVKPLACLYLAMTPNTWKNKPEVHWALFLFRMLTTVRSARSVCCIQCYLRMSVPSEGVGTVTVRSCQSSTWVSTECHEVPGSDGDLAGAGAGSGSQGCMASRGGWHWGTMN